MADRQETPHEIEFDLAKFKAIPAEQQELYLLLHTSRLAKHVAELDADGASAEQIFIKRDLITIVSLESPAPSRVIRNNLGRCFAGIFGKGDRKLLFDTINELLVLVKNEKDGKGRHAAVHCLGDIFEAAGDSAISLGNGACNTFLKLLKGSQNNAGLRGTIFRALSRTYNLIGRSIDDAITKDVWKQARSAASSDKALIVQINAFRCLESLIKSTSLFDASSDFDSLKLTVYKAIDSTSPKVRHAAAACFATVLVKSYSENAPSASAKKKSKAATKSPIDGEEIERPESPAPKKDKTFQQNLLGVMTQISSHYTRSSMSHRSRSSLAITLAKVLRELGPTLVEASYSQIAEHLLVNVLDNSVITTNRYRLLTTRKFVRVILEDVIGTQMLGEAGQISAAKTLVNHYLKNYPPVLKERPEPSKQTLTGALSALDGLIKNLGAAVASIADLCRDGLVQVLQHHSYTVQVATAHCLRTFVLAYPQQLLPVVTICMNSVNRELGQLSGPRTSARRCVGFANGLAATLSASPQKPLHGSVDVNSRVLSLATGLLKSSSSQELRISSTQIQVAWTLIGGLMSLGPNFVKIHLSQLLLLWKNALPRPLAKDNSVQRGMLELSFLAHVRECALGSILAFLKFNSKLLTTDVAKRIASMLQNTTLFLNGLPSKKTTEETNNLLSPALQLLDFDMMVRRRVLQCYVELINLRPQSELETLLQSNLLTLAVKVFADPDNFIPSSLSASIANATGTSESLWDVTDNYAFGVTSMVKGFEVLRLPGEHRNSEAGHWLTRRGAIWDTDQTLLSPVCGAREHDSLTLYTDSGYGSEYPTPPATEVVNSAIRLFAVTLPLQPQKVQESILEQIVSFMAAHSLQREAGRRAAINVNVAVAVLSALKVAVKDTSSVKGDLKSQAVEKLLQDLLRGFIVHNDHYVRNIGIEGIGRLCSSSGNSFTTSEVKYLIDTIVANREPNVRAGCAGALGSIHAQVGAMAAGLHMKTILGVLMSLANDPHPTVHFWSLDALSRVAESAGLNFSGYVTSTLGMLSQLYMSDSHHEEVASAVTSSLEVDLPTILALSRCVGSLVNVLGPDLQDAAKPRDLITSLTDQLLTEDEPLVTIQSLKCLEDFAMFAAGQMHYQDYVRLLQHSLQSFEVDVAETATKGLRQLMKLDAESVIRTAEPGLEEQLLFVLDDDPRRETICEIYRDWLSQTQLDKASDWIDRCQSILSKTRKRDNREEKVVAKASIGIDLQDEEVAGFAAATTTADEKSTAALAGVEPLRWQIRAFAMSCLGELLSVLGKEYQKDDESPVAKNLISKLGEIIKTAFSASTATVVDVRVWGLRIIEQVLRIFGRTPDPDFPEATILEQYQAQISSALTPAFAADSSPELAAEAINVCAVFISTGIVTEVDRMGRILKLLEAALDSFSKDAENAAIGDLRGLSPNAQVMIKMAIFSAWAELQVSSVDQKYLADVMKPHVAALTPLWLSSLREFAKLRFEPDISTSATTGASGTGTGSLSGNLDVIYAALNRETLLKFYQESWLKLVAAIASLIEQDSEFVFSALDGDVERPVANGHSANDINYRDEPVAFFFVLFGIAFEALVSRPGGSDAEFSREQTDTVLLALKRILRPEVSGQAIYQDVIFSETMDLFDRLVLTEGVDVQSTIIEIVTDLCIYHPSARRKTSTDDTIADDIDQLFELTRIIVLVLGGIVPGLGESDAAPRSVRSSEEHAQLAQKALNALGQAADVFPNVIKLDLYASIFHILISIFSSHATQADIAPQALPMLRKFVTSVASDNTAIPEYQETLKMHLRSTLLRLLSVLRVAQRREHESDISRAKNVLLAATILVGAANTLFPANDPLLRQLLDEILDCLEDRKTSFTAIHSAKLLLSQKVEDMKTSGLGRLSLQYFVPRLVAFVSLPADSDDDNEEGSPEKTKSAIAAVLVTFVSGIKDEALVGALLAILVPAFVSRASAAEEASQGKLYVETARLLISLAGVSGPGFRSVLGEMPPEQKVTVEQILRQGGGLGAPQGNSSGLDDGASAPKIELRMDFG